MPVHPTTTSISPATRRANLRAAVVLVLIAAVFFAGVILSQAFGQTSVGISVLGVGIVGFLVLAIGRNIRR